MKKLTQEEFIKKANKIHNNFYNYSKTKYINSRSKVTIICPIHGEFKQLANNHLQGLKCPICANRYKLNNDTFIKKFLNIHGNKYDCSKINYINNKTKICIVCPKHGEFKATPSSLLSGSGCPKCANEHRNDWHKKNTKLFIEEAVKIHKNKYDYSKVNYINDKTKICIICKEHGEFYLTPHNHIICKQGCPKCQLKSLTKLYERLKKSFPNEEILFEVGNSIVPWLNKLRFDIYFPKYNIAIEYNGILHYIPVKYFGGELLFLKQLIYDNLKYQKCKENNCTLFEIKYNYSEKDYNNLLNNLIKIINNN